MASPANVTSVLPDVNLDDVRDNAKYLLGCVFLGIMALQYVEARKRHIAVPAVGPSGRLTSYYGVLRYFFFARAMLREGYDYEKLIQGFHVQNSGYETMDSCSEFTSAHRRNTRSAGQPTIISFQAAIIETLAPEFTFGRVAAKSDYHTPIVRSRLTRNIAIVFDDITEEIVLGFEDEIGARGTEWVSRPALPLVQQVVSRASNRVFVGLPVCRDKDYIDLTIRHALGVVNGAGIIRMIPSFMEGLVGEPLTSVPANTRRAIHHLGPILNYRLEQEEKFGADWLGKPNDILSWLLDAAQGEQRTILGLAQRILMVNFAAIHTSSMIFTHALFHLAARPEYIASLREEVERVVKVEGWTKAAMQKMRKVDSFLRETQRYNGISCLSMTRKALVDYTLSDGTFLPAGTTVECNSHMIHMDDANYVDTWDFQPFRFSDMCEESANEEASRFQVVSTSNEYLTFGHGRHACPGCFFAANELKCMLACVVMNYDIKLPNDAKRPPKEIVLASAIIPNPKAHVLFRRRHE